MASPLSSRKATVDLAAAGPRVSRIRRDPPPAVKKLTMIEIRERDSRGMMIGVVVFALALFVIFLSVASYNGWTPSQYTLSIEQRG